MSYNDVYLKRLNRYGDTQESRIQGQRIADFERYRQKSIYKIDFLYNNKKYNGVLEPNKQDESKTTGWLLTRLSDRFNGGSIIDNGDEHWLISYLQEDDPRGYNKYLVIKMNYYLEWNDQEGHSYSCWGFFSGPMQKKIEDLIKNRSGEAPDYHEPAKSCSLIIPTIDSLRRQDYLIIGNEGYYVTGYDKLSTPGIEYVSITQSYKRAEKEFTDGSDSEMFWLNGGN